MDYKNNFGGKKNSGGKRQSGGKRISKEKINFGSKDTGLDILDSMNEAIEAIKETMSKYNNIPTEMYEEWMNSLDKIIKGETKSHDVINSQFRIKKTNFPKFAVQRTQVCPRICSTCQHVPLFL